MENQTSGTLENLTPEQAQVRDKVREFLNKKFAEGDVHCGKDRWNDWYILRFCRARKFDYEKIIIMIEKYLAWLKEVKIDEIGKINMEKYDKILENSCHGYCGVDKLGRPVYIDSVKHLKAS